MRKLIFSSKDNEFTGSFFIIYSDTGIQELNFTDASLTAEKRGWIKKHCPAVLDMAQLKAFVEATRTEAIESTISYTFEDFWTKYDKKINRKRCLPLWSKMSPAKQASAVVGVPKYDTYLRLVNYRTKADPENYLRNEMWENEWK